MPKNESRIPRMFLLKMARCRRLNRPVAVAVVMSCATGCFGSDTARQDPRHDVVVPQVIGHCDETFVADAMAALRRVGVAASRASIDAEIAAALSGLSSAHPDIYSRNRACFFDFIDRGSVSPYGGDTVYFPRYYEVWVVPGDEAKQARLCAGANPDGWDAGSLIDTAHPRAALVPEGYPDKGPARRERFRPVCRSEKDPDLGHL